ncbi:sigma-70 family RNA polymerase sigma factor [Fulvivirgaceae bacterium BMA10]|uniref:Sigma-70 family RNA polymerase sigma factor n=1 Tax=Splendidivirga corallicola TaxID=3051826 RepID=A0ABT8KU21_9BACT|nr:sigma-70 family RNA polymerase sigma factor [Fulvivirgaceae bacterium BMA10]
MKTISSGPVFKRKNEINAIEDKHPKKDNCTWSELTDAEVWSAYKHGNKEAFIHIYKTYNELLYNYGMQLCLNHELVKDNIQETFFYLQRKSKDLADVQSIKYYLYKILRRKLIAAVEQERKFQSSDEFGTRKFGIIISPELKLINSQLDEERKNRLRQALNKLPERQREAILLFYYEGFTHDEIAQIMGLKSGKYSRKHIYRGVSTLRDDLVALLILILSTHTHT